MNVTAHLPHNSFILWKDKACNPDFSQSQGTHGQSLQYKRSVEIGLSVTNIIVFLLVLCLFADGDA